MLREARVLWTLDVFDYSRVEYLASAIEKLSNSGQSEENLTRANQKARLTRGGVAFVLDYVSGIYQHTLSPEQSDQLSKIALQLRQSQSLEKPQEPNTQQRPKRSSYKTEYWRGHSVKARLMCELTRDV